MDNAMILVLGILAASFVAEAVVEYMIKKPLSFILKHKNIEETQEISDMVGAYSAAAAGVALSFLYQMDVLRLIGLEPVWVQGGYIVTGLMFGRGSNWMHDFAKRFLGLK